MTWCVCTMLPLDQHSHMVPNTTTGTAIPNNTYDACNVSNESEITIIRHLQCSQQIRNHNHTTPAMLAMKHLKQQCYVYNAINISTKATQTTLPICRWKCMFVNTQTPLSYLCSRRLNQKENCQSWDFFLNSLIWFLLCIFIQTGNCYMQLTLLSTPAASVKNSIFKVYKEPHHTKWS